MSDSVESGLSNRNTTKGRDNFSKETKEQLSKRVAGNCSNPQCRCSTSGPHSNPASSVNIGVAAHIVAASPGGPRGEVGSTSLDRSDISNGIWLCQCCAKLIDSDVETFNAETLRQWKTEAEQRAKSLIERASHDGWTSVLPDYLKPLISLELTTPPPITQNISRSSDGQFWLVYWDTINAKYRWEKISEEYAAESLAPVCKYRNLTSWRDLFPN